MAEVPSSTKAGLGKEISMYFEGDQSYNQEGLNDALSDDQAGQVEAFLDAIGYDIVESEAPELVACQVLHVVGYLSWDGTGTKVIEIDVPSFTLTWGTFNRRIQEITQEYYRLSESLAMKPSLGDFALYLARKANADPFEQRVDG